MSSFLRNIDIAYTAVFQDPQAEIGDLEDKSLGYSSEGLYRRRDSQRLSSKLSFTPWVIIAILAILNIYQWVFLHERNFSQDFYSPAQSAIKYKDIVTTAGLLNDTSPYQGDSNETDSAWKDLYNYGLTRISMDEASKLVNRTVPIPGEPGNYMVTLNVFHHLHCLNMIRKRVWLHEAGLPAPPYLAMGITHMDHCIDGIRQALMCSADITPRPYGWDPLSENVIPVNHVIQKCRDFDAIRDWAIPRRIHEFDWRIHVEDPLGNVYIEEELRKAWPNGTRPEGH